MSTKSPENRAEKPRHWNLKETKTIGEIEKMFVKKKQVRSGGGIDHRFRFPPHGFSILL